MYLIFWTAFDYVGAFDFEQCTHQSMIQVQILTNGYGSIPINTIFSGMNIDKSQLFWCSPGVQGFDTSPNVHHIHKMVFSWPIILPCLGARGTKSQNFDRRPQCFAKGLNTVTLLEPLVSGVEVVVNYFLKIVTSCFFRQELHLITRRCSQTNSGRNGN